MFLLPLAADIKVNSILISVSSEQTHKILFMSNGVLIDFVTGGSVKTYSIKIQ